MAIRVASWTFCLEIDTTGRFPNVGAVVPRPETVTCRLRLELADVAFLVRTRGSIVWEPGTGNRQAATGNRQPGNGRRQSGHGRRQPGTGNREAADSNRQTVNREVNGPARSRRARDAACRRTSNRSQASWRWNRNGSA